MHHHQRRDAGTMRTSAAVDEDEDDNPLAAAHAMHLLQRDRQLRGAVLLQRSFRRFLNRTYDREDAARTIQACARRYLQRCRRGMHHASSVSCIRAPPPPPPRPVPRDSESRRSIHATAYADDDDEDDVDSSAIWGDLPLPPYNNTGTASTATATGPTPYATSRSTAPLTDSGAPSTAYTPWQQLPLLESSRASSSNGSSISSGSSSASYATDDLHLAKHQPQYEVFLWQGTQHGLELASCRVTGFPVVVDASKANVTLPGMWRVREGDVLLAINDYSVHASDTAFADVDVVLESGVRPAILRFRRARGHEVQARERMMAARGRGRRSTYRFSTSSSSLDTRRDIARQRERTEATLCYLVWREEDGPLGIRFACHAHSEYPEVSAVRSNGAAARATTLAPRVAEGDLLLSVNDHGIRNTPFKYVLQVLHCSPRPLVLVFRRAGCIDRQRVRMYEL